MTLLQIMKTGCFQIVSVIFFGVFLLGALNIHFSERINYCVMTCMFECPQFVRITVPDNYKYPQYGLYAYSEGRLTEKARKMWFDGVPVLFLPGNFGSHKQSRSLASVALRKAISNVHDYHFDYFTVDYNEELSGLYGGVLEGQTEFAAHCIRRILSLYKSKKYTKTVPTSVILIGHSMGGLIAKRLLSYPNTENMTRLAITLAAPLAAPVFNFDIKMNDYYMNIEKEATMTASVHSEKVLLSFGSGPRDVLIPSSLTSSYYSDLGALTTSVPGVWVSPDHVSIVWCKQLVMAINKYLFSIVDIQTKQIVMNKKQLMARAEMFFQAGRTMVLDPNIKRPVAKMIPDGFWYEDNRRIYQISRPEISKTTYLMIRLVSFPQNRFVAIESVNLDDGDWLFGCNANDIYGSHRYCKSAESLTELSRWTAAADTFGKRKLATVHLHKITELRPTWTHVLVKVSPTRKPVVLNVDINDYASRVITVDLPYMLSFGKTVIKEETEKGSIYYELLFPGLDSLHQTYYLYVEPTAACKANQHHASAELHVPWAKNHEYYHYFTHLKQTPMKIRLFKMSFNTTMGLETSEPVKITLLLDPQCSYTVSISPSLYHEIAQVVRNYYHLIVPYVAAVILLATRSNINNLRTHGACVTMHGALNNDGNTRYYLLVCARLGYMIVTTTPLLAYLFETANTNNEELRYFLRSLWCIPAYMTALGVVNVLAAVITAVMVFSSQLANRLLFRIVWRGTVGNLAERVATGLQKIPTVVSVALVCSVPLSCGAAALAGGAAFYSFMISKMYEEYLEDYVYKIMAKVASKFCFFTLKKRNKEQTDLLVPVNEDTVNNPSDKVNEAKALEDAKELLDTTNNVTQNGETKTNDTGSTNKVSVTEDKPLVPLNNENEVKDEGKGENTCEVPKKTNDHIDEDLNCLNFHMMMFLLWITVTIANIPALITWARNFKYSIILQPDTSFYTGLVMSLCAGFVWQIGSPRRNLKHYALLSQMLFGMSVLVLVLGPFGAYYINYIATAAFMLVTIQQMFDEEIKSANTDSTINTNDNTNNGEPTSKENHPSPESREHSNNSKEGSSTEPNDNTSEKVADNNCECDENRIYDKFKNLRDKYDFTEDS